MPLIIPSSKKRKGIAGRPLDGVLSDAERKALDARAAAPFRPFGRDDDDEEIEHEKKKKKKSLTFSPEEAAAAKTFQTKRVSVARGVPSNNRKKDVPDITVDDDFGLNNHHSYTPRLSSSSRKKQTDSCNSNGQNKNQERQSSNTTDSGQKKIILEGELVEPLFRKKRTNSEATPGQLQRQEGDGKYVLPDEDAAPTPNGKYVLPDHRGEWEGGCSSSTVSFCRCPRCSRNRKKQCSQNEKEKSSTASRVIGEDDNDDTEHEKEIEELQKLKESEARLKQQNQELRETLDQERRLPQQFLAMLPAAAEQNAPSHTEQEQQQMEHQTKKNTVEESSSTTASTMQAVFTQIKDFMLTQSKRIEALESRISTLQARQEEQDKSNAGLVEEDKKQPATQALESRISTLQTPQDEQEKSNAGLLEEDKKQPATQARQQTISQQRPQEQAKLDMGKSANQLLPEQPTENPESAILKSNPPRVVAASTDKKRREGNKETGPSTSTIASRKRQQSARNDSTSTTQESVETRRKTRRTPASSDDRTTSDLNSVMVNLEKRHGENSSSLSQSSTKKTDNNHAIKTAPSQGKSEGTLPITRLRSKSYDMTQHETQPRHQIAGTTGLNHPSASPSSTSTLRRTRSSSSLRQGQHQNQDMTQHENQTRHQTAGSIGLNHPSASPFSTSTLRRTRSSNSLRQGQHQTQHLQMNQPAMSSSESVTSTQKVFPQRRSKKLKKDNAAEDLVLTKRNNPGSIARNRARITATNTINRSSSCPKTARTVAAPVSARSTTPQRISQAHTKYHANISAYTTRSSAVRTRNQSEQEREVSRQRNCGASIFGSSTSSSGAVVATTDPAAASTTTDPSVFSI